MKKATFLFIVLLAFISHAALSQVNSYAFTATTGAYNAVTGISPVLSGDAINSIRDEGFANNIPLGFTFNYLGTNYTSISASTNGFATFGVITTPAFSNNIASGGSGGPLIAPFWEDIALAGTVDLQYSTTGNAGNRIFILQWGNAFCDFAANDRSLSFQLRLYEGTNVIEFIYNQLPGPVQDFSGGASIGITAAATGHGNFLSLSNSSSLPAVSSVTGTDTIKTRPANGQIYRFTPPACMAPGNLSITSITANEASFTWTDGAAASYEFAVTSNASPPSSGTATTVLTSSIAGLTAGTQYYLHVRKDCGGTVSGWNSLDFATVTDTATIPYMMPISNVMAPVLPVGTTVKDENLDGNTWRSYSSAGDGWSDQVLAYVYNINTTTPANDWLFTKPLRLEAGTSYRLSFKYNNDGSSVYREKLKVAYGTTGTSPSMVNILADYPLVSSATPKTATIDFTPAASDAFYIGFQVYSDANKNVLILDDISVNLRPSCEMPDTLSANAEPSGTSATVNWTPPSYSTPLGYEYVVNNSATPPASGMAITSAGATVNGLTPNIQYYMHVRSVCDAVFSAWATLAFATVGNDNACNAMTVTAGGSPVCGDNTLATSVSDPIFNCSSPDHTVWFQYTPTSNGSVVLNISTPGVTSNPLHGWVGWFQLSANCPSPSMYSIGACAEFGNGGNNDLDTLISPVLSANTTYLIMIDGYSDDVGEFCLSMPTCAPPLAVNVSNILSTTATVSWSGSGQYILEYGPSGFTPGTDDNAGAGAVVINSVVSPYSLTGLAFNASYDVYVRRNCSPNEFSGNSALRTFITHGPPPVNDDCSGAISLPVFDGNCGGATNGTTLNATLSATTPYPSCGDEPEGYDDDVWYSFTPVAGELYVNIDFIFYSGYGDITAQVYTTSNNDCSGTFSLVSCKDDGGPNNTPRFTGLPVIQGKTYYVRVFSDSTNVNSQFAVCVTKGLPLNDNASGALPIMVDAPCTGANYTNDGATQSPGEPAGSCSSTTGYATVWYKFLAPGGGAVRISTAAGSGNTLTNTRIALFSATNEGDYSTFNIIACDEDGGTGSFGEMSVLYATGLIPDNTYYIQVDKFDNNTVDGSFCLTIDKLRDTMLSVSANCNTAYQPPVGSVTSYKGWVSLLDANSRLIAMVRNPAGGAANVYTAFQHINNGAVRRDNSSNEFYLNRSWSITNTANLDALDAQFFFLNSELAALTAVDPAATLTGLRVTSQTATACRPDFEAGNGVNSESSQTGSGTSGGVSWIATNIKGFCNYYIHAVKSYLNTKVFLQGAFDPNLGRHKDVTPAWANVLNTYAKNQPYNTAAYADTLHEGFGANTAGGKGFPVYHVTNLNATGPGSLHAGLWSNRTIVFDVGGIISDFTWYGSSVTNLTIDGSTAPSPGITLVDNAFGDCLTFGDVSHDIIIKNIRIRNAGNDGISVINSYNILIDHVSVSGSGDGDIDITDRSYNVTVQWSILGAGKLFWAGAMLIAYPGTKNISLHHNLYTSSGSGTGERNPFVHNATDYVPNVISYLMADFTNNIVWKWGHSSGTSGFGSGVDYGGTLQARNNFYQSDAYPSNAIVVNPNSTGAKLYASGNVSGNSDINPNIASNVATPWTVSAVTTQDVCTAAAMVIDRAGPRPLDETDQTFINSVSIANCQGFQNQPPIVHTGRSITVVSPGSSAVLTGTASDEDGTISSYLWTGVNGAGTTYNLESPNASSTVVSNLQPGTYSFQLTVKDNDGGTTSDEVSVVVVTTGSNQTPVVNAGLPVTITLPTDTITLNGSAADADGSIANYTWSLVSGPAGSSFENANEAITTVSNLVQGTYVFKLSATDNTVDSDGTGSDNVTVIVNAAPSANTASYGSYTGTESVASGFFTSSPETTDITDWVMLEIKNSSGSIMSRRAAFVREDGKIVDMDGTSPVALSGLATGNYYLTVRHRNHLSLSTQNLLPFTAKALGVLPSASANFDFSTASDADIFGDALAYKEINGTNTMIAGNANGNNTVRYGGQGNDPASILLFLGSWPLTIINNVYSSNDVNLDGTVKYGGSNNDVGFLLSNALGGLPTLIVTEQKR